MGRKKKIVENLTVVGIADKGMAVAKDGDGMVYFVKNAVPGDVINLLVLRKKKGFKTGIVHQLVTPSPQRTTPFCKHFELCGGCKWQNLSYQDQLKYKQENVTAAIQRIAKSMETEILPILGAEPTRFYRNKLEYSFSTKRWLTEQEIKSEVRGLQKPALGFHAPGTYDKVIDVEQCFLQEELSNEIRNWVRQYAINNELSYFDIKAKKGFFRNLIIRNSTLGEWMVNVVVGENDVDEIKKCCGALASKFPQITSLFYTINQKANDTILDVNVIHHSGKEYMTEQLGDLKFKIGPKSFFQTNSFQAKNLYDKAIEFAQLKGNETVYDLYTGTGSIALYLSQQCKSVVGIESVKEAIDDAKENAANNKIGNAHFLVGDVKDVLNLSFRDTYGAPDVVITDPPRAGMHKDVVETLLELESPKIVYVSCNPATQARDIQLLGEKYFCKKVQAVDMFPHTSHIESVALLIKK